MYHNIVAYTHLNLLFFIINLIYKAFNILNLLWNLN